jgi:hypothetical protein
MRPLTPQQMVLLQTTESKQMLIEADGEEISAVNAAVKINKLLQICGGASLYGYWARSLEFDVSSRLKVVHEVVDETSNKVLGVRALYAYHRTAREDYLTKHHITCEVINGGVSCQQDDQTLFTQFQNNPEPKSSHHSATGRIPRT